MSMALPIEGPTPRKDIVPPLLELRGISKQFPGVKALDDVSFAIWPGEVHMLLGENGAGKSSLMKVLCGAYSADSGEFNYKGEKVAIASTADAQKLGIAVIFQEFSLVPHLDIAQNIFLGREPKGHVPGTIGRRADPRRRQARARLRSALTSIPRSRSTSLASRNSRWWRSPRRSARTRASW